MKGIPLRFTLLLFLLITIGHIYSQRIDPDRHRSMRHHKPPHWPRQVITQQNLSMSPAQVINFQALADSEAAHPLPSRTGSVEQIEDKDANFKFIPHTIPATTPVFDPDQLPGAAGSRLRRANAAVRQRLSPAPLASFLGTTGNGSLVPPDVAGATGPTYVFEVNNQQFDIYTKAGVHHATLSINTFFNAAGGVSGGYFDPHISYDANYGKFIVIIDGNISSNNDGGMFIAVSQTSDPNGLWWTYAIDNGDASTTDLLDYPQLGYNNNWVVITANDFLSNSTVADIYVLDRASLYSGTLGTVTLFTDNNAFSWGPAQTYDTTTATLWMVQNGNGGNGAMQIGSITGTVANPVYNAGSNISVTSLWNENSVDAGQKGGGTSQLINSDDTRIGNGSVFINGTLWFTHAVWLPATGTATNAATDWWQITPSTLTLNQFGRIEDPNGNTNYYYPSINVNSNNDALLGYCVSGTDSFYGSAAYSFRAGTDAVNTMQSRYIYKTGLATYYQTLGGTRNRYGDYTGTAVDPVDNSFWNFSEYANTATVWGTVIAHVAAPVAQTIPPVAGFSGSPTLNTCGGLVRFTDLSTNAPTAWAWSFGDGATSTQQNPNHTYSANGTYTVSLQATNAYGSNTQTLTSYITVSLPSGPAAPAVSHCGSATVSLAATTSYPVAWFDSTGRQVSAANPFVTPALTRTATYFVQDTVLAPVDSVGADAYGTLGAGGFFTGTNQHYMTFDALTNFTLVSVVVNASTAGTRTIELLSSGGTVIATASPNIPAGVSTVTLNFSVPVGTAYELSCQGTVNLYRNNAVANSPYPYTLAGIVSITGNDVGAGYYYYFYNWKVRGASCVSVRTPVVATIYPGGLTATPVPTQILCHGASTGAISLNTAGGTSAYTYSWTGTSQASGSVSGLTAGTYTVTVTDAHSCTTTATSTLTQPAALSLTGSVTNVACLNSNTGSIAATVSGGTSAYQYAWSTTPRQTTGTATSLTAGSYTVTVTDAHSCTSTATFAVTQPANGITLSTSAVNAACGASNGSATVNVLTGPGTYTYAWSGGGGTAATAGSLAAGNYTVTVSSAGGCSATASVSVSSSGGPTLTPSSANTTCGNNNGSASILVNSGTAPYTYAWSNAATDSAVSNLAAGTYTVTVRDVNGCASISSVTVTASNGVSFTHSATATICGGTNGSAAVSVSSPGSPAYAWSNAATTASISNVASGSYTVTVTDNGCATSASIVVGASSGVSLQTTSTATSCGSVNGSASVTLANPVNPTYHWSTGATTATISNAAAGTYTVTVIDGTCTASASVSVSAGSGTLSVVPSATAVACFGGTTGAASVAVTGGTPTYTYQWANGQTGSAISGLASGIYPVTISDAGGCSSTETITITQPAQIVVSGFSSPASCSGHSDGAATVTVAGGTAGYTYQWTGGQTTSSLTNVASGIFTVTVTDAHHCTISSTVTVGQSAPVVAAISVVQPTGVSPTGTITIDSVTGGSGSYTLAWSNSQTGYTQTNLGPGTYTVTITDTRGCDQVDTVIINSALGINNIKDGISFSLYPNPAKTEVVIDLQNTSADGTISLKDILGQTLMTISSSASQTRVDLMHYVNGVYFIEVAQGGKRAVRRLVISR